MKSLFIICCFLLLTGFMLAQTDRSDRTTPNDPTIKFMGVNPQLNIPDRVFELDLQFKIWQQQNNFLIEGNKSNLWLRTELALTAPGGFTDDDLITVGNFSAPLYERYQENQKFNPLFYVLGMAQTAAVGYMAYQHIKKYGFFK